ncbi:hypothetical protein GF420_15490, partial [candidate division GN15 bacterium]|nr:hypothetical protein [candidate division GN15 bacterium]
MFLLCASAGATTYYVSPSGDDGASGLSEGEAWATLDRGDRMGILTAGDTIKVLPGTYYPGATATLSSDGAAGSPVVYMAAEDERPLFDGQGQEFIGLQIDAARVEVVGLEFTAFDANTIFVGGNNSLITDCYIHDVLRDGMRVIGDDITIRRNIITRTEEHAIYIMDQAERAHVYGNSLVNCHKNGVEVESNVTTIRIFNNLIVSNDKGIFAKGNGNVAAFNLMWNNNGEDYGDGIVDSAGGVNADPLLADTSAGDFSLLDGSPAIDAGLDLGYWFHDSAP